MVKMVSTAMPYPERPVIIQKGEKIIRNVDENSVVLRIASVQEMSHNRSVPS